MIDHDASNLFFSVGAPVNIKIKEYTKNIGNKFSFSQDARTLAYLIVNDDQVALFKDNLELNTTISINKFGCFRVNIHRLVKLTEIPKIKHSNPK